MGPENKTTTKIRAKKKIPSVTVGPFVRPTAPAPFHSIKRCHNFRKSTHTHTRARAHFKGRFIDGFRLDRDRQVSVENGWNFGLMCWCGFLFRTDLQRPEPVPGVSLGADQLRLGRTGPEPAQQLPRLVQGAWIVLLIQPMGRRDGTRPS